MKAFRYLELKGLRSMAKEWFNKIGDMTDSERRQMLIAYRNVFFRTDDGKHVTCHLKTVLESSDAEGTADEQMVARRLFEFIMDCCGVVDNLKIVEAMQDVADKYVVEQREPEKLL